MNKDEIIKNILKEYLNDPKYDIVNILITPKKSGYMTHTDLFSKTEHYSVTDEVFQDKQGGINILREKFINNKEK